ncbi:hypothetical protein H6P81_004613 [Aristolochia fimbriata]|uniref:Uncharacterized protein n=1 Tax=Aristolochia fimbriata TaxID=158543 RepID=A0AAV7ESW7_ARIFI|nr:hypothetical protein H6P81_004613 [Aristolochia fimbriata]
MAVSTYRASTGFAYLSSLSDFYFFSSYQTAIHTLINTFMLRFIVSHSQKISCMEKIPVTGFCKDKK